MNTDLIFALYQLESAIEDLQDVARDAGASESDLVRIWTLAESVRAAGRALRVDEDPPYGPMDQQRRTPPSIKETRNGHQH